MEVRRKKIDSVSVEWVTGENRDRIDKYERYARNVREDKDKATRHAKQLCQCCYRPYTGGRMACAAVTHRQCGLCDEILVAGSSDVDVLCTNCAERTGLCKKCGGDIDMKHRRKKRDLTQKATA